MTQLTNGRIAAKALFEAGDRPTDQNFTDLFDSIIFLGENNPNSLTLTTIQGNVLVSGSLSSQGAFVVNNPTQNHILLGKDVGDEPHNKPLQVYGSGALGSIIFASGSVTDIMFEGESGDASSSIQLTDILASVQFGTHTNKGFLSIHGEEIMSFNTGSGNITSFSSSVAIGTDTTTAKFEVDGGNQTVHGYFHGSFAGSQGIKVQRDSGDHVELQANFGGFGGGLNSSDALRFSTNNAGLSSPVMYIETDGRVGIGNTSPISLLHLSSSVVDGPSITVESSIASGSYIRFKNTTQHWRVGKGNSDIFSIYDATGATTPFIIEKAAADNTLRLDAGGRVGVGHANPTTRLHVSGNLAIGTHATPAITLYDKNTASVSPDILFNNNALLAAQDDFYINIDSDNSTSTSAKFKILANAQSSSADEVFYVSEAGDVSASGTYYGDGSQLTGITGTQLTGFVNTPGTNRLITSNDTGNSVFGEELLIFDDDRLIQYLDTGNTVQHGIYLMQSASNGGVIKLTNNTSTSNEFIAQLYGAASSGMTGTGIAGLYLRGKPAQDHANNPCIVIRGQNQAYDGVSTASDVLRIQNYTTDLITINKDGDMGIGTTSPLQELHVKGNLLISSSNSLQGLEIRNKRPRLRFHDHDDATYKWDLQTTGGDFELEHDGTVVMHVDEATNKIGIGHNAPQTDIHVHNNATANAYLLLESSGSNSDSGVALRQEGSWPSSATGVDLVYDGGTDYFYMKTYTAAGGFQGNAFSLGINAPGKSLWIDDNGYVGFGIDPDYPIHVTSSQSRIALFKSSDATSHIRVERSSNTTVDLMAGATSYGGGLASSHELRFMVNGDSIVSPTMTIDTNNRVGIGVSNPAAPLEVIGSIIARDGSHLEASFTTPGGYSGLVFNSSEYTNYSRFNIVNNPNATAGSRFLNLYYHDDGAGSGLTIRKGGKVGIGTSTPGGKLTLHESTGTAAAHSGVGTLVLSHGDSGGKSSITFRSQVNPTSDYGFIEYHDHEQLGSATGTSENSLLEIGAQNDNTAANGDAVAISTGGSHRIFVDGSGGVVIGGNSNGIFKAGSLTVNSSAGTIGGTTMANSHFLIGTTTSGLGMDTNEIYAAGTDFYIGTMSNHSVNIRINGSSTKATFHTNGNLTAGPGKHTQIGYQNYTDYAVMSHADLDDSSAGNYAIMQHSGGTTYVNASSGKKGFLRINNTSIGQWDSTGFGVIGNCTASGYMSADYIYLRDQPPSGSNGQIILGATGDYAELSTEHGYYKFGMGSTYWAHHYTNASIGFYFDKQLVVNSGVIASYDEDLYLRRDHDDTSYNEIQIKDGETIFRQDNDIRFRVTGGHGFLDGKLYVGGDGTSHTGATATPSVDLAVGDADTGLNWEASNVLGLYTAGAMRMRLSSDTVRMFGAASGYMIGANAVPNASATLHVKQRSKTGTGGNRGIVCEDDEGTGYWNISFGSGTTSGTQDVTYGNVANMFILSFNSTGQNGGWAIYNDDGGNGLFTGQHRNIPQDGEVEDYISKVGHIVSSTGNIQNQQHPTNEIYRPNINEALPKVKLSDIPNDKKAYGVVSDLEDPNSTQRVIQHGIWHSAYTKPEGDTRLIINSVGEGAVMVSNINGNIENGDYITTSAIEGIGMKQDDDLLHNYTVAKAVMDCDFSSNSNYILGSIVHNGVTYKTALIGCTYHCG